MRRVPIVHGLRLPLLLAGAFALHYLRRPDAFHVPQFWAEDGSIFYQQACIFGPAILFEPYANCLHALPRLIAWLAVSPDPLWSPAIFVAACSGFTLHTVARVFSGRWPVPHKAAAAVAVVLVPDTGDVLLNVTNLLWIAAGAFLLLLIFTDAKETRQHVHDCVPALPPGLTGSFSILFTPLFWGRVWQRRTRASVSPAALVTYTSAVQAWTVWRYPLNLAAKAVDPGALAAVTGLRVADYLLTAARLPPDPTRPLAIALGIATVAASVSLAAAGEAVRIPINPAPWVVEFPARATDEKAPSAQSR